MANNKKVKTENKKNIAFANVSQKFKKKKNNSEVVATEVKKKKPKRTRHIVLISIMGFLILCALACLSFCVYIIATAPPFEEEKLYSSSSSNIYDMNGELIAQLGSKRRENVTYDDLPEVLVDAIVATEDSKFFQHSGIDLLRFSKAIVGQLLGQSNAGGGSTITMQLAKNTYNGTVASGIQGITRKFKDIYMSIFKIEKTYSKQEILEFYVNQAYFGSGAHGVEAAAQTYFGKSVKDLNLPEAATLAGLFQAPDYYDAYVNTDGAQMRRNQVLGLMVRHEYITMEEAEAAMAIPLKEMLSGYDFTYSEYQGFIDTVIMDVIDKTGVSPMQVSMNIYTTLDVSRQNAVNKIFNGTLYKWKNEYTRGAIAVTDVHTGAVVAVGANRGSKALALNYATQIKRHPGSIAKPIFDYGPAIEYSGWGSGTFVMDDFYTYTGGNSLNNVDGKYLGIMNAKTALGNSRNVPALQAFQATTQQQKYDFVTGLGITPELHNNTILESSSIGAFIGSNAMEMSAAYGAFARGGYYIEPYTFTKIEYTDTDNDTYVHTPTRTKVMSEETAYIMNHILTYSCANRLVDGCGYINIAGSDIASKTGTSSEDYSVIKLYKLPNNTIRDSWQVVYSPDYSMSLWYGYDENNSKHYMLDQEGWAARQRITQLLTPYIMKKNSRFSKPSGVIGVEIEKGTDLLASEYTPANLKSLEYYRKGTEPTETSIRFERLKNVSNLTYTSVGNQVQLSWDSIGTPQAIDEDYLEKFFKENYARWSNKYFEERLDYNKNNIGTVVYDVYIKNTDGSLSLVGSTSTSSFNTTLTASTSATYIVRSSYSIFKDNASSGSSINVKTELSPITPPSENNDDENDKPIPDEGENDQDQDKDNDNDDNNSSN